MAYTSTRIIRIQRAIRLYSTQRFSSVTSSINGSAPHVYEAIEEFHACGSFAYGCADPFSAVTAVTTVLWCITVVYGRASHAYSWKL